MMRKPTAKERMDRLREHLGADTRQASQALTQRMTECGVRWGGDYECQSPACVGCRRRYIGREQKAIQGWLGQHSNSNLGMISVVLEASSDLTGVGEAIVRSRDASRNRLKACRRKSGAWDGVCLAGWHEIDAVAADHIPLLPPQRRKLVEQIVPWSLSSGGPAWITTYHGIVHFNGLTAQDIQHEFRRQWPLERQVHVQPFHLHRPVSVNINRIVSYAHKFACTVKLSNAQLESWPVAWQTEIFGWLQGAHRNAFETLRFSIGPKQPACSLTSSGANAADDEGDGVEVRLPERGPMPYSFTGLHHPHYYTGGQP